MRAPATFAALEAVQRATGLVLPAPLPRAEWHLEAVQFAKAQAALVDRVPQKELAAFLGVTAVGLNRIVRRVSGRRSGLPPRHVRPATKGEKTYV